MYVCVLVHILRCVLACIHVSVCLGLSSNFKTINVHLILVGFHDSQNYFSAKTCTQKTSCKYLPDHGNGYFYKAIKSELQNGMEQHADFLQGHSRKIFSKCVCVDPIISYSLVLMHPIYCTPFCSTTN